MKCLIVDDEAIARRGMEMLVSRHSDLELCASLACAEDVLTFLSTNKIDLIFLDIQMPGLTGIELARMLPEETLVVFTTAYSRHAVDAYELSALDYLVKPIRPSRFDAAVEKARKYHSLMSNTAATAENPQATADHIIVKADRRYVRIRYADILYVEGLKDYVIIHTHAKRVVTRITLKALEQMLPAAMFIRVNKSCLARIEAIDAFDSNDIFIGDTEIAIGNTFKDNLLATLLPR